MFFGICPFPIKKNLSRGWFDKTCQQIQECRLPAPCRSDNADEFSFADVEAAVFQYLKLTEILTEILNFYFVFRHNSSSLQAKVHFLCNLFPYTEEFMGNIISWTWNT